MKKILVLLFLAIPYIVYGQRVQLSGIPGQESDMDINDMLNQIMAPYYQEVTNLQNKRRDKEIELKLWNEFQTNVNNFDRVNRYIFGYESAFRSLTNENSDPSSLEISVERIAKHGEYQINIQQLAQVDAFSSKAFPVEKKISPGIFTISMGDVTNNVQFLGGTILTMADVLRNELSNIIDVKIINTSSEEKTLMLSGKKEGKLNAIRFDGDITPLLDIKLLTKGEIKETNIAWQQDNSNTIISNTSISLELNYEIEPNTALSFNTKIQEIIQQTETNTNKALLSELPIDQLGSFSNDMFVIPGADPIFEEMSQTVPIETNITPIRSLSLVFNDGSREIITLSSNDYYISLEKHIDKILVQAEAVGEQSVLELSDLLFRTTPEGALKPYHEISKAQDAHFLLDGVDIYRSSNVFSDLISGVTFNLLNDSQKNITIKIKPDIELVKDTIIQWVMQYNNLMEEIFILTTVPIEKIGRLKPLHQREKDGDDLKEGAFYGNTSINGFKDKLRRLVGIPHNRNPNEIALLDQIGIFVQRRQSPNADSKVLRKGTLTLEVPELEKKLEENFDAVHKLFISDTDGDNVGDTGVSIAAIDADNLMVGGNGYLTRIEKENGNRLKELSKDIAKKDDEIDRVQRKERKELLEMSQAVAASKAQNESLKQRFGN